MKYQVIIVLDDTRNKSYFYSYVQSGDSTLGNIECTDLPPYQDINKARSCYWDSEALVWVFDEEKYTEILAIIADKEADIKQKELEASVIMTNKELTQAVWEILEIIGGTES